MADAPGLQWRAGDPHSARHGQAHRARHRDQRHHHDEPPDVLPRPRLQGQGGPGVRETREVLLPSRPRRADERDVPREGSARAPGPGPDRGAGPAARAGPTLVRLRDRRWAGAGVAACAGLRRWAARLHPDAGHAPGERGAGPAGAEPRRGVGPRELPGPAPVLRGGPALRHRGPDHRRGPLPGPRDDPAEGGRAVTPQRDDPELRGPARLAPPRVAVVRLNRPVLHVVRAVPVVVVVAGLVALRAQSSRLAQDRNSARASQLPPAGERWFDKGPDREPSAPPTSADTPPAVPASALHPSTPAPTRTLSDAELEAQRRGRPRRAAQGAPPPGGGLQGRAGTGPGGR